MTEIRDITKISLPTSMRVVAAPVLCWVVVNDDDTMVDPVRSFMAELAADGTSPSTRRPYCHDLLRWWAFLRDVDPSGMPTSLSVLPAWEVPTHSGAVSGG